MSMLQQQNGVQLTVFLESYFFSAPRPPFFPFMETTPLFSQYTVSSTAHFRCVWIKVWWWERKKEKEMKMLDMVWDRWIF